MNTFAANYCEVLHLRMFSPSVKAVHLELVTSEAFIACLKQFISRHGLPSLIWSDNGTNLTGAARELKEFYQFLRRLSTQDDYLSDKVTWKFIPQHAPYCGGIWEATVAQKGHVNYRFQPFPFPIWKFLVTNFQFADLSLPISLFRVTNFQFAYFLLPN